MANLVSWAFYTLRKKIDPKQWVASLKIKNFEDFKAELKKRGIKVPSQDQVMHLFDCDEPPEKINSPAVEEAIADEKPKKRKQKE